MEDRASHSHEILFGWAADPKEHRCGSGSDEPCVAVDDINGGIARSRKFQKSRRFGPNYGKKWLAIRFMQRAVDQFPLLEQRRGTVHSQNKRAANRLNPRLIDRRN